MSYSAAPYRMLLQIVFTIAAALLFLAATHFSVQAEPARHMIVIPASDGYGFDDCLGAGKTCGKVIADAWCEAHGLSAAESFGRADDVTASVAGAQALKVDAGSFIVNCGS